MKKAIYKILLFLILLTLLFATISNASYSSVTMEIVEEPICKITFGSSSYVERSVISKDLAKKEITLQLKVVNEESSIKPTGEIMLVIDNSKSMLEQITLDGTREDLVIDSAKTLITNLLTDNDQLKIGAVSFSTNIDVSKEGSLADAQLISELTNDIEHLTEAVSTIEYNGPRTNLDAGITLAKQYFSESTDTAHKYVIVLSDGVPNVAIDYDKNYYSDNVITKTKTSLQSLSTITNNVIVMLTGISNGEATASPSTKTYDEIISSIFGTESSPTIGKFYYITDDEIENTITSDIYKDLIPIAQTFQNLNIVDTFTQEIIDNFNFSYVKNPNFGTISSSIDKQTNSITWIIPELASGETAIVQYKLSLKENYNEAIVGKILDTNSNLSISYDNLDNAKSSNITPKLKLTEPEKLPVVYPKTGKPIIFVSISLLLIITILLGNKYNKFKNI